MADKSHIEWTDATWNPIRGCSRVSQGCVNCYAEKQAARIQRMDRGRGVPEDQGSYDGLITRGGQWNGQIRVVDGLMDQPLRWKKPRRVFVNSMGDLFHEVVPDSVILSVFTTMAKAKHHTFQVLTKRPKRMRELLSMWQDTGLTLREGCGAVLPNVWLGVSVENQSTADERIPLLLLTPAAVRWISAEPLLDKVDITKYLPDEWSGVAVCDAPYGDTPPLDWVVAGGESSSGARPMHPDWVRLLRDQCQNTGVPFFFKQWGEWLPGEQIPGRTTYARCDNGQVMTSRGNPCRENFQTHPDKHSRHLITLKIGKKAAGRQLDGCNWDELPMVTNSEIVRKLKIHVKEL